MPSERKPCVCIFSALYLPTVGGVETYTANLAKALRDLDYRVIVATLNSQELAARESSDGIDVVRFPCRAFLGGRYPVSRRNAEYRELRSWLQSQTIDYVIVNTRFYLHSYAGLSFSRSKGIAPVLIEHGSAHLTMGNPLIDKGVECVEHLVTAAGKRFNASYYAVSKKASAWLEHFSLTSCGELYNAIDADAYLNQASARPFKDEFDIPETDLIVAFVGRMVPEKGVQAIAEAASMLGNDRNVTFLLAGGGPLFDEMRKRSSEKLHLLGKLSPHDVSALLAQADLFCLPSRSEGFATSLLEAAACYTPSIVTDVGGVDELIPDNRFGTVIENAEPQTVAEAVRQAAEHREELAAMGTCVGELVRAEFSWKKTAERAIEACKAAQLSD